MIFGWDTGLIGGIVRALLDPDPSVPPLIPSQSSQLPQAAFQASFGLTTNSKAYADLSGWIVAVLQAGCFFVCLCSSCTSSF